MRVQRRAALVFSSIVLAACIAVALSLRPPGFTPDYHPTIDSLSSSRHLRRSDESSHHATVFPSSISRENRGAPHRTPEASLHFPSHPFRERSSDPHFIQASLPNHHPDHTEEAGHSSASSTAAARCNAPSTIRGPHDMARELQPTLISEVRRHHRFTQMLLDFKFEVVAPNHNSSLSSHYRTAHSSLLTKPVPNGGRTRQIARALALSRQFEGAVEHIIGTNANPVRSDLILMLHSMRYAVRALKGLRQEYPDVHLQVESSGPSCPVILRATTGPVAKYVLSHMFIDA